MINGSVGFFHALVAMPNSTTWFTNCRIPSVVLFQIAFNDELMVWLLLCDCFRVIVFVDLLLCMSLHCKPVLYILFLMFPYFYKLITHLHGYLLMFITLSWEPILLLILKMNNFIFIIHLLFQWLFFLFLFYLLIFFCFNN